MPLDVPLRGRLLVLERPVDLTRPALPRELTAERLSGWRAWCRARELPCDLHAAVAHALARGADYRATQGRVRVMGLGVDEPRLRAAGLEWDGAEWVLGA